MKQPFSRFRLSKLSSFTLVELLVVIGIIAILAAIILSAGTSALRAAKRTKAMNTATQLQTAALAYYTEYGVYPVGSAATDTAALIGDTGTAANQTAWGNLIYTLCGNIYPSTGLSTPTITALTNARAIPFLTLKSTDVDSYNAPVNPLPTGTGTSAEIYFNIAMDADYDGLLGVSTASGSPITMPNLSGATYSATGGTSTAGVAVWANCNSSTSATNVNFYVHTY